MVLDSGDDTPSASIAGESGAKDSRFVPESGIRAGGSSHGIGNSSSYNYQHKSVNRI